MNYNEMAIEILQATRDGDDLSQTDLALVQRMVNAGIYDFSEAAEVAFYDLYQRAVRNTYVKPWLCGIEHLTQDHEGYVFWKGRHVEHYSFADDQDDRMKVAAEELARRCRIVEARGQKPDCTSVVWLWREDV